MFPIHTLTECISAAAAYIIPFHEALVVFITFILLLVIILIAINFFTIAPARTGIDGGELEYVWTFLPGILLAFVAFPSLRLLYIGEVSLNPNISVNVIGHQWYWTYYYPSFGANEGLVYDSFITPTEDLTNGEYRLLEASPHIVLPYGHATNVAVSSADVLHSWAVSALSVKLDAIPGRLNNAEVMPLCPGLYYGQCSEICGANHSFMPITLEAINNNDFLDWVLQ